MKKSKKIVLGALALVLVIAMSVAGTIAYLTATADDVINTFTVGNIQIKLDEAPVDETGKETTGDRVKKNDYNRIKPGDVLDKDPMVTVIAKSEDCYVKMNVVIEAKKDISGIISTTDPDKYPQTFVEGFDNAIWTCKSMTASDDGKKIELEFWYKEIVPYATADKELEPLFTKVVVPKTATNEDLAALNETTITITASAIQSAGFDDATAAWAAFPAPAAETTEPTTPTTGD